MSDMEIVEIRQRIKAMTREELEVVVKAIEPEDVDVMWKEIWRRYREKDIQLEFIDKSRNFRLE